MYNLFRKKERDAERQRKGWREMQRERGGYRKIEREGERDHCNKLKKKLIIIRVSTASYFVP